MTIGPASDTAQRHRSFRDDVVGLLIGSLTAALTIVAVAWAPLLVLDASGVSFDESLASDWTLVGRTIGPLLAGATDPLLPTLLTLLIALGISEIWRVAPPELLRIATAAAVVGATWSFVGLTSVFVSPGKWAGIAVGGAILGVLLLVVAGWIRHISPVGLHAQLREVTARIGVLSDQRDGYARLFGPAYPEVRRRRWVTLIWFAPLLVPTGIGVAAIVSGEDAAFVLLGLLFALLQAQFILATRVTPRDPVAQGGASTRFLHVFYVVTASLTLVIPVAAAAVSIGLPRLLWGSLAATGLWVLVTMTWAGSPFMRVAVMAARDAVGPRLAHAEARLVETRAQLDRVTPAPAAAPATAPAPAADVAPRRSRVRRAWDELRKP